MNRDTLAAALAEAVQRRAVLDGLAEAGQSVPTAWLYAAVADISEAEVALLRAQRRVDPVPSPPLSRAPRIAQPR